MEETNITNLFWYSESYDSMANCFFQQGIRYTFISYFLNKFARLLFGQRWIIVNKSYVSMVKAPTFLFVCYIRGFDFWMILNYLAHRFKNSFISIRTELFTFILCPRIKGDTPIKVLYIQCIEIVCVEYSIFVFKRIHSTYENIMTRWHLRNDQLLT